MLTTYVRKDEKANEIFSEKKRNLKFEMFNSNLMDGGNDVKLLLSSILMMCRDLIGLDYQISMLT
jgi:hypothetical protein